MPGQHLAGRGLLIGFIIVAQHFGNCLDGGAFDQVPFELKTDVEIDRATASRLGVNARDR
jgi:hypothetical protein